MTDPRPALPPGAAFPALPGHLLGEAAPCAEVMDFLVRAAAWRETARAWLASPAAMAAPLSEEMRRILPAALGDERAPPGALAATRTYRLEPFPRLAPSAERSSGDCARARRQLLNVLVWRSRLVDFLSDVWDVMGPPLLDLDECEWVIRELLTPHSAARLCTSCLQPLSTPELEQRHFDTCPVRIARGDPELG